MGAVQTLGYSPNFGARALAAKCTNTIGAIIPTMENAIFARGIQAFQEALDECGVTLLVASSSYCPRLEAQQIKTLVSRGADGLLLIGHSREPSLYEFLRRQSIPALVAWAYQDDAPVPSVGFDNELAMHQLAERVLALGHRRIGVVSASIKDNDRAAARVLGIRRAMRALGLDDAQLTLIETEYGIDEGAEAFSCLMAKDQPPTVVMCGNDVLAVGALHRARAMGLSVPKAVSITGFDDIELAKVASPALTTVHVPHRQMGTEAAHCLVRMVRENAKAERGVCLPTRVCERASLGPVTQ